MVNLAFGSTCEEHDDDCLPQSTCRIIKILKHLTIPSTKFDRVDLINKNRYDVFQPLSQEQAAVDIALRDFNC